MIYQPIRRKYLPDVDSVWSAVASRGSLPELHPPGRGKVCALGAVEPGVEAGVVATGEGDHDLALVLHYLVVGDAVLSEDTGADQTHLVSQIRGARLLHLREQSIRQPLKPPDVGCGDGIPELRRSKVEIVDAVEVHVLSVPSK